MKKISVITPVLNTEDFIQDCINSVANSITLSQLEIEHIIVDDFSTDHTVDKIQESILILDGKSIIKLFPNKNPGRTSARNLALKNSDSDFVFCLDADDVIFQNSLRYLIETVNKKGYDWVYGDFLRTNEDLSYLIGQDYYGWEFNSPQDVLTSMYSGTHFFQQNSLFSRETVEKAGNYNEQIKVADDFDLMTRILLNGTLPHYIRTALYLHRFHSHNLTPKQYQQDKNKHLKDVSHLYDKYENRLKKFLSPSQIESITKSLNLQPNQT